MSEDVCESWEELAQTEVLNKKLAAIELEKERKNKKSETRITKILSRNDASDNITKSVGQSSSSTSFNLQSVVDTKPFVPRGPQVVLEGEDSNRTQFNPPIKILARQSNGRSSNSSLASNGSEGKKGQFNKTYEEREAEYNEARKRILGSPCSTSTTGSSPNVSPSEQQTSSSRPSPNGSQTQNQQQNRNSNCTSSKPACLGGSNITNGKSAEVPIVRNPIGPDGSSRGFKR